MSQMSQLKDEDYALRSEFASQCITSLGRLETKHQTTRNTMKLSIPILLYFPLGLYCRSTQTIRWRYLLNGAKHEYQWNCGRTRLSDLASAHQNRTNLCMIIAQATKLDPSCCRGMRHVALHVTNCHAEAVEAWTRWNRPLTNVFVVSYFLLDPHMIDIDIRTSSLVR